MQIKIITRSVQDYERTTERLKQEGCELQSEEVNNEK